MQDIIKTALINVQLAQLLNIALQEQTALQVHVHQEFRVVHHVPVQIVQPAQAGIIKMLQINAALVHLL